MDDLSQISQLIKEEDIIGIEEFYFTHGSSLIIDTQGSLAKVGSYISDEVAKSSMPSHRLHIEKGQTAVPVRYDVCVHSKQSL